MSNSFDEKRGSRMRIRSSIGQKLTLRRVAFVTSSVVLLLSVAMFFIINLGDNRKVLAASTDDYQSKNTAGNWNSSSSWQRYNSGWSNAGSAPTSANGVITIQNGHTITVTANVTVDQIVVNSGGILIVNSGVTLTIANGSGTDLDVHGTVRNAGTITVNASATIIFQNNGIYQHNHTTAAGTIPTATWATGSECQIIGYTSNSSAPSNLQTFYDFTWNCPSQAQDISLGGSITTINGTLSIVSTGTKNLWMTTGAYTLNVNGDLNISGGNFELIKGNQVTTLNLAGNFIQSGGTFTVVDGNNNATLNLSGKMTHSGGTITQLGGSIVTFVFKKTGTQVYAASGNTVSGSIDYTVNANAILDLGSSALLGRNFTVSNSGGLVLGSVDGISSSGATGNIQVSGTRIYNTGSDYTFGATGAQITGDGVPATVRNFTVNNTAGLTLSDSVTISGTLTFSNGKITTGINEITVTNTSTGSVTGNSSTKYIVGSLRRSVTGTGSYNFPIGTAANYELANVNLASTTGVSSILCKFTNVDPVVPSLPIGLLIIQGILMDDMLTYGYWTITPNAALATGTVTVSCTEIGQTNSNNSGCTYSLINRTDTTASWASVGTHTANTQVYSAGAVTAVRSALTAFGDFGIVYGELLSFAGSSLISGSSGNVNAVYLFPDVCSNVDAWVSIIDKVGGATLATIDWSFSGYNDGWQPFINAPANSTSYIQWQLQFKIADTSTDTILPWVAITAIDIDGDANLQEFVETWMPYSFSLGPGSVLTTSNSNGWYRATSTFTQAGNIDTTAYIGMFQAKFKDVNKIAYRMGSINNSGSSSPRQNSYFFKSFFTGNQALPIELIYFDAKLKEGIVKLSWATAAEINNSYFTVERSSDGETFEPVSNQRGANNSTVTLYYSDKDTKPLSDISYYRLKQTDFDGHFTFSDIVTVKNRNDVAESNIDVKSIYPNPFSEECTVNFYAKAEEKVDICLINSTGQIIAREEIFSERGFNDYKFSNLNELKTGLYFITVVCGEQKITKKVLRQ